MNTNRTIFVGIPKDSKAYKIFTKYNINPNKLTTRQDMMDILFGMESEMGELYTFDDYNSDPYAYVNNPNKKAQEFVRDHCCFGDRQFWVDKVFYMFQSSEDMLYEMYRTSFVFVTMKRIIYTEETDSVYMLNYNDDFELPPDLETLEEQVEYKMKQDPFKQLRERTPEFDDLYIVVRKGKK